MSDYISIQILDVCALASKPSKELTPKMIAQILEKITKKITVVQFTSPFDLTISHHVEEECNVTLKNENSEPKVKLKFNKNLALKICCGIVLLCLVVGIIKGVITSNPPAFSLASYLNKNNDLKLQYNPKGKTYFYTDKTGKSVITLSKDITNAYEFSEGLAIVVLNGKYGAIDETGAFAINPIYDNLWKTTDGLTAYITVENENKVNLGYLDKNGNIAIEPRTYNSDYCPELFLYNPEFANGLAVAYDKKSKKYGYIDKSGDFVINPQFDLATSFSENLAAVSIGGKDGLNGKYGYIDKSGKIVIAPQFDQVENIMQNSNTKNSLNQMILKMKNTFKKLLTRLKTNTQICPKSLKVLKNKLSCLQKQLTQLSQSDSQMFM